MEEQPPALGLTGDDDIMALAEQRLRGGYAAAGVTDVGVWEIIIPVLIKVGFDLLLKCLQDRSAADVQQDGRSRPRRAVLATQAFVRRELRERYGLFAWHRYHGDACTAALLDAAASSTSEEVQRFAAAGQALGLAD